MRCAQARTFQFRGSPSKTGFEGLPITAGCVMLVTYMLLGESLVRIDFLLALTLALSILMVSTVSYPKIRNIRDPGFCSFHFRANHASLFVDVTYNVQYMRIFSILPFILMLTYIFSPFFKIPLLSNLGSKEYRNKGLKAGGRKEKQ